MFLFSYLTDYFFLLGQLLPDRPRPLGPDWLLPVGTWCILLQVFASSSMKRFAKHFSIKFI